MLEKSKEKDDVDLILKRILLRSDNKSFSSNKGRPAQQNKSLSSKREFRQVKRNEKQSHCVCFYRISSFYARTNGLLTSLAEEKVIQTHMFAIVN